MRWRGIAIRRARLATLIAIALVPIAILLAIVNPIRYATARWYFERSGPIGVHGASCACERCDRWWGHWRWEPWYVHVFPRTHRRLPWYIVKAEVAGVVVGFASLALFIGPVFSHRLNRPPHLCWNCRYDLTGVALDHCPECSASRASRERHAEC